MKTSLFLMLIAFLALQMPACLPIDEDLDQTDPAVKFLGIWKVSETCRRGNYNVSISKDPGNSAQVLLENFGNPGSGYDPAVGLVVTNKIYISSQTIGEGWTVSGTGTYQSDGSLSWDYTLLIGPSVLECTATFTK